MLNLSIILGPHYLRPPYANDRVSIDHISVRSKRFLREPYVILSHASQFIATGEAVWIFFFGTKPAQARF